MRHELVIAPGTFAVVVLLVSAGCGRVIQCDYYDFDLQKPLDYRQLVFKSSDVVVGSVRSVEIARSGISSRKAPELLLDETRVDIDVENVLRGEWSEPRLRFKFFAYSTKNRGGYAGPALYRVESGERRIFFLTKDSGEFRSVADVRGDYSIRVWSGLHRGFPRSEARAELALLYAVAPTALGGDISTILLDVGEGHDAEAMAGTLTRAAMVSDELASRKATVSHLQRLTANGQSRYLRIAACLMLAEQYAGQSNCLYALGKDLSLLPTDHQLLLDTLAKCKRRDVRLKQALRTRPMGAFNLNTVTAVRDELELLLADPDTELSQLGCEALRRGYGSQPPRCGPAR